MRKKLPCRLSDKGCEDRLKRTLQYAYNSKPGQDKKFPPNQKKKMKGVGPSQVEKRFGLFMLRHRRLALLRPRYF